MAILLDTHVHIYPQFSIATLLDSTLKNFTHAAEVVQSDRQVDFGIVLTEGGVHDVYASLSERAANIDRPEIYLNEAGLQNWVISTTGDSKCLLATNTDNKSIYIYCGRQLISKENLELLSLFVTPQLGDGEYSLKELADIVFQEGGLPVVPWGVGKWTGRRKQVVADFINNRHTYPIILGDNGNRPSILRQPVEFASTKLLLSGSDPLPLKTHQHRAGSYGICIPGVSIDASHPINSLIKLIRNGPTHSFFGTRVGLLRFFADQLWINVRKRIIHQYLRQLSG